MHEILTLSLSQSANHLITHFYNAQESYLDYTRPASKTDSNDPAIHFKPTILGNSVNYNPRALIWDLNGGFGALGQFDYVEGNAKQDNDDTSAVSTVISKERIHKNDYQKALDEGKPLPKLTPQTTRYWTDYSRVIFEPKSFNVLTHWEFDPVKYPKGRLAMGKEREFVGYDTGVGEWQTDNVGVDFLEEKYRVSLEECDLLNGLNIVSELDSSWAGFSNELLCELRDDYNPKSYIFSYALFDGRSQSQLSNREAWDRIRGLITLQKHSSVVLPLGIPKIIPNETYGDSKWFIAALQNAAFESLQVLGSQNNGRKSFHELESSLTLGSKRNLISSISWKSGATKVQLTSDIFKLKSGTAASPYSFATTKIQRPSKFADAESFLIENTVADSKDKSDVQYLSSIPYAVPDSYPEGIIDQNEGLQVELGIDTSVRKALIEMRQFVTKIVKGDERADAIEDLGSIAQDYEHGWSDSEDSDDDY